MAKRETARGEKRRRARRKEERRDEACCEEVRTNGLAACWQRKLAEKKKNLMRNPQRKPPEEPLRKPPEEPLTRTR